MLRHRRFLPSPPGPSDPQHPVLPMTASDVQPISDSPPRQQNRRKRLKSRRGRSSSSSFGCCCLLCVLLCAGGVAFWMAPMFLIDSPSLPTTTKKTYPGHIDSIRQLFPQWNRKKRTIKHHRNNTASYEPIVCPDGTTGFKNDDYCDCLTDGRDEPNTAACSRWLVHTLSFPCGDANRTTVYASRVNDGVIDCPNGSDER
jgi:hypothetical protein